MKAINYNNLAECQLLGLARKKQSLLPEINKEWYSRYRMNFPYRLDIKSQIINAVTDLPVKDAECDKLILLQAERLRERRRQRLKSHRNHGVV